MQVHPCIGVLMYITIQDAADRLAVGPRVIRRMIATGELPGYRLRTKVIRVRADDVDALLRPIPTAGVSA
jgi:excisionase family DNA binding protein